MSARAVCKVASVHCAAQSFAPIRPCHPSRGREQDRTRPANPARLPARRACSTPTHEDVADPRLLRFLQLRMASDAVVEEALILRRGPSGADGSRNGAHVCASRHVVGLARDADAHVGLAGRDVHRRPSGPCPRLAQHAAGPPPAGRGDHWSFRPGRAGDHVATQPPSICSVAPFPRPQARGAGMI